MSVPAAAAAFALADGFILEGKRQGRGRQSCAYADYRICNSSSAKFCWPLMAADNGRSFASVANAMDIGRTDRVAANASHFVGNVVVEAPLGTLARNGLVPRIRRAPDDIAIVEVALCARGLRDGNARANRQQRYKNSLHCVFSQVSETSDPISLQRRLAYAGSLGPSNMEKVAIQTTVFAGPPWTQKGGVTAALGVTKGRTRGRRWVVNVG
jgi:hypothetical protein